MAKKVRVPSVVRIDFLDHCQNDGGDANLIRCTVWGVLYRESAEAYHVSVWGAEGKVSGDNCTTFAIAKGVVLAIRSYSSK